MPGTITDTHAFPANVLVGGTLTAGALATAGGATIAGGLTLDTGTFSAVMTTYANDGAAATGGVPVGGIYRNGSILMIRAA